MKTWMSAILGVGLLASGCGAEQGSSGQTAAAPPPAARQTGGEMASARPATAAPDVVVVDEARIPVPAIIIAEVPYQAPATGAQAQVQPTPAQPQAQVQPTPAQPQAQVQPLPEPPPSGMLTPPPSAQETAELRQQREERLREEERMERERRELEERERELARREEQLQQQQQPQAQMQQEIEVCPADIPGVQARSRTIARGAALVLSTTNRDEVEALRNRMREFALLHARSQGTPSTVLPSAQSMGLTPRQFGDLQAMIHQARDVRLIETPRGVRVEFRLDADEPRERIRELRTELREDARALAEGLCPVSFQVS